MRLIYITVPVGILFAAAGGALIYAAKTSAPLSDEYNLLAQPRHPVTPEMWKQAHSAEGVAAPEFQVTDTDGRVRSLNDLTKDRPLFLYFVLEGCPCSIEAEPHYERLAQQFQGRINFLAVSNAKPDTAKKWKSEFSVPFPVVSQPGLALMNKFGVERAVYCLLIDKGGKIVSMWPGYSASMLQEVNQEMADLLHQPPRMFDTKEAPKLMTSGCAFVPGQKS